MRVAQRLQAGCPGLEMIQHYLQESLSATASKDVAAHLDSCSVCQDLLTRLLGDLAPWLSQLRQVDDAPGHAGRANLPSEEPPVVERYEVLGHLGTGGMGVVWRVRDLEFGRDLALKVIKHRLAGIPSLEIRFLNEAYICGRLAHPCIVPVHSVGRCHDGRPYYVMKLVEGHTLGVLCKDKERTAEHLRFCLNVFGQVCQAVGYAHRQGVIHRDLTPANVMVGLHGEVQLMDWGLAKLLNVAHPREIAAGEVCKESRSTRNDQTDVGTRVGTWSYMSPEQALGIVAEVNERSDVFGLGAILCEILTGEPPYGGSDLPLKQPEIIALQLVAASQRLATCGADDQLIQLATQCLAFNPGDRPVCGDEVAAALTAYHNRERERRRAIERNAAHRAARRNMFRFSAAACAAVLLPASFAAHKHLAASRRDPNQLYIGIKPWVGYTPLAVADGLQLCSPVTLHFVPVHGLVDAKHKLLQGAIDVAMWLVDTHVLARSDGISTKVILKLDESLEADKLFARSGITHFSQLIGRRVAYQKEEASYFMLYSLCQQHGMDIGQIHLEPTTAEEAARRFAENDFDAATTYEPHVTTFGLDHVAGASCIASAADVPGKIVDVLTVKESYLEAHSQQVRRLVTGWFTALSLLTSLDERALRIARQFNGFPGGAVWKSSRPCSLASYAKMARGVRYCNQDDNRDFFHRKEGASKYDKLFKEAQQLHATRLGSSALLASETEATQLVWSRMRE